MAENRHVCVSQGQIWHKLWASVELIKLGTRLNSEDARNDMLTTWTGPDGSCPGAGCLTIQAADLQFEHAV